MTAPSSHVIALHVDRAEQLFNTLDPAPFRERDLDPQAVDYIIERCANLPAGAARDLELLVHVQQPPAAAYEPGALQPVVRDAFERRAVSARRRLKQMFSQGRLSLLISLLFLGAMFVLSDLLQGLTTSERRGRFLQESVMIIGWVALWRPAETFLYDWWPVRAEIRLYERLSRMRVRVEVGGVATTA